MTILYTPWSTHVININLYSEELDEEFGLDVIVTFLSGEQATYWEPGSDDEIEIIDIDPYDFPVELSYNELWSLIDEYEEENYNEILTKIWESYCV